MKQVVSYRRFQGIADFEKETITPDLCYFCRSIDFRSDPNKVTLLPKTTLESGSVVTDLVKWMALTPTNLTTYAYDLSAKMYSRSSSGSWNYLFTSSSSHGNGLSYYAEDDYLYYTNDATIGRYGPLSATPTNSNDFLGSAGGVPTNTNSISLVAASSQYAKRADTASLSITSDLTLEADFKLTTLPAIGNSMTLISKWDESGATRSYIMDIYGVSGYFGDGSDGALTISADTTEAPIDSACTGTVGTNALTATNVNFTTGQQILIHQSQGASAGVWERNKIAGYTAGTITTESPLSATYTTGAQVRVLKQYTNVTINSGKTYTAKGWTGTVGGILAFLANGTVTVTGNISASGLGEGDHAHAGAGFRGATSQAFANGVQGEGYTGTGTVSTAANTSGGGGASGPNGSGAGGGNGAIGTDGSGGAKGGIASGNNHLTNMTFGGGGGSTAGHGGGGDGGGIVFVIGVTVSVAGSITANGFAGATGTGFIVGGAGGGAGGSILLKAQTATLGSAIITATGGAGGAGTGGKPNGGAGASGRIHLDYYTSYTGTTSPTLDFSQDNTLVTTTTYQARLGISNDGTANEFLTKNIDITTAIWYRLSISWDASASLATYYINAVNLGTTTGTKTAIHDNGSEFAIGSNKGASAYGNFIDGLMDDVRVWNRVLSDDEIFQNDLTELSGAEGGLAAYYKLNGDVNDATANANNLTAVNTPTYSTDVPFPSPSTRQDIDLSANTTGNTYTTPTTISEAATARLTFTPTKDPQVSIDFYFAAKGTGTVTVTIHDTQNRTVATASKTTAQMGTGYIEFTYATVWRPVLGRTYHAHVTSTVADTTIRTTTAGDLETASYHTYFGFLVTDSLYHPVLPMLNMLGIGNERYLATWEGIIYEPNRLTFPSGWHVRCLAYWREYFAIGMWRGGNIYDYNDQGRIYFWDGISDTFNFFIDVPEGGINAMLGSRGELHVYAGHKGDHLLYTGGDKAVKVRRTPKISPTTYVEILPGAVTMYNSLLHTGVAGNTDSTVIEQGVYSWGSINLNYPECLSYDYPISTGTRTGSTLRIGCVYPAGKKLLIGWQDNTAYGVDVVDPNGAPFASGTMEFLIKDFDTIWRDQMISILRGDFLPLNTGESVDIKLKINRATTWTSLDTPATSSNNTDGVARLQLNDERNREFQFAFDLFATGSTSPTMLGLSALMDDLAEEQAF